MRIVLLIALTLVALLAGGCGEKEKGEPAVEQQAAPPSGAASNATLTVSADKTHAVQPGDEITLTLTLTGFELDAGKKGQANEPGIGHYHIYLDEASGDDYLATGAELITKIRIPADITDGSHQLRVNLHNNDHSLVDPPVEASALLIVYRL